MMHAVPHDRVVIAMCTFSWQVLAQLDRLHELLASCAAEALPEESAAQEAKTPSGGAETDLAVEAG